LLLCPSPFVVPPICLIVGRPCACSCEAKESALIHVLMYLNVVLRYTLGMFTTWSIPWRVVIVVGVLHFVCNETLVCNNLISTY
jgi:hypothetical protein